MCKNYSGVVDDEKKFEDKLTCNSFDRIPACDRQTDRRTDILRRHSPRYAWHRAVNMNPQVSLCGRTFANPQLIDAVAYGGVQYRWDM